jgi:PAS domain S-box-containing protein
LTAQWVSGSFHKALFTQQDNRPFLFSAGTVYRNRGAHQMNEQARTNPELIEELSVLKQKIQELEDSASELKRAEEALRASNELFSLYMRHSPIYTYIKEVTPTQSIVLQASDNFGQMIGIPGGEMIGKTMSELFPPELAAKITADDWAVVSGGDVLRLDEELNGRSYNTIKFPIVLGDKTLLAGYTIDITEHKQVAEALKESEERYRTILESIEDGYFEVDIAGNLTFFNDSVCRMSGYNRAEMMGMNNRQYTDKENSQILYQAFNKVFRTGEPSNGVEYEIIGKDGTKLYVESAVSLIRNTSGQPIGFRGIMRNITERKRAADALRKSEEQHRTILQTAMDGFWLADTQGHLLDVNETYCRLSGYSLQELLAMCIPDLEAAETGGGTAAHIQKIIVQGEDRFESHHRRKDGSVFDVEVSVQYRPAEGGRFVVFLHDITDRNQAEEEKRRLVERLQRAEKMESLGLLAGGVAHDLNNVLGIVVGYSEMLLDGVDKASPIRHSLENVMNGGLKAAAIVEDLLTLARRGVSGRDVLNLNKIIADCQQSTEFEKLYSYHPAVKIKTDLDPGLLNISGSSVHLDKTVFNLVSNASEAMAKGGIVTITTTNQYLDKPIQGYDQIREGDYVVLSVSDTGEGIHEADLKRIFEPFYTKKVMGRSGTGLGLAVAWGTVKDHHGYINVQSEEGKGSTFTLYFPVTREDITAEAVAIAISEYMGSGKSILVVDDVKEQRDLAAGMLRTLNYNVSSVSSGEEAVAYMKEHKVDLIVLDMIMDPGMDGLDTYRSILEIRPKQKAIIVSGFSETERVKAAKALGSGAYVRKPYIKEKLGLAVRKEMDRDARR